jgi:oligopeptide/dipeptide ABC transporter ATP-binding protein
MEEAPALEVRDLYAQYTDGPRLVKAVDGVSLTLRRGEIVALVGESGCGKTTVALAILGLLPTAGRIQGGQIIFGGHDLASLDREALRRLRGREISMIVQDPVSGLNPVLSVGQQVEEIITNHLDISKREARALVRQALDRVGLPESDRLVKQYPFQLSGGMCQRVIIAIATVLNPSVLIADEPTSALDMTVQAGILSELERLRDERGCAILLITHDLGVVAQTADEVVVMYAGRVAERGRTRDIFRRPRHPYTWSLLASLPRLDRVAKPLPAIEGAPPELTDLPDECAFIPRCRKALTVCRESAAPALSSVNGDGHRHQAACYNPVVHAEE